MPASARNTPCCKTKHHACRARRWSAGWRPAPTRRTSSGWPQLSATSRRPCRGSERPSPRLRTAAGRARAMGALQHGGGCWWLEEPCCCARRELPRRRAERGRRCGKKGQTHGGATLSVTGEGGLRVKWISAPLRTRLNISAVRKRPSGCPGRLEGKGLLRRSGMPSSVDIPLSVRACVADRLRVRPGWFSRLAVWSNNARGTIDRGSCPVSTGVR